MNRLLSAPDPLVHSVLVALCDDARIQARALKYLAELEDYAARIVRGASDSSEATAAPAAAGSRAPTNPLKRKKASMPAQLCVVCRRAFSPGDNSPTACLYHGGELLADAEHEMWADWNDDVAGPRDAPECVEDFPERFTWSCCDEDGTTPGCMKGYHLAVRQNSSKRFRLSFPPGAEPDRNRTFEGRALKANEFVNETLDPSSTSRASEADDSDSEGSEDRGVASKPEDQGMLVM